MLPDRTSTALNHRYHLDVPRDLEPGDAALCGHRYMPVAAPPADQCEDCIDRAMAMWDAAEERRALDEEEADRG